MATPEIRVKDVGTVVKKWLERARAGVTLYSERVKEPRRDPIKAAISMRPTIEAKMTAKETWDKWEQKLSAVGFNGWLDAVLNKGVQRYPQGIEYGQKKFEQFYSQFKAHLEQGLPRIYAIQKRTLDDSIQRAAEMIRWNAKFRFIPRTT